MGIAIQRPYRSPTASLAPATCPLANHPHTLYQSLFIIEMYSKLALIATAGLAIFATAAPTAFVARGDAGTVCCNTKQMSNSPQATKILGLLGVVVEVVQELGLDCLDIVGSNW